MIEVLKQLVDALENHSAIKHPLQIYYRDAAIEAGLKAIAELESQKPDWKDGVMEQQEETILWQAKRIAELIDTPSQSTEPPDWFPAVENILNEYGLQAIDFVANFKAAMKDAEQSQRTWVGLTDEEIEDLYFDKFSMGELKAFAKAIEAKLKEKNT
jgi:hypothetical protein